jgi:uncharacterized membrane protein YphA (DoxX/SURF4 family)
MSFGDDRCDSSLRPNFLAPRLGGDVFDRGRRSLRTLGAIRHAERRLGRFRRFAQYTGQLNPWAPAALVPALAWAATAAELALGVALLLGLFTRWSALLSGILLLLFASGMSMGTGIKSALNASVFSAAAGFALAVLGPGPWSVDGLHRGSPTSGRAA